MKYDRRTIQNALRVLTSAVPEDHKILFHGGDLVEMVKDTGECSTFRSTGTMRTQELADILDKEETP